MDWIMEIPSEVIIGFWLGVGTLVSAIIGLIVTILNGAKSIREAQAERQKRDLEADSNREAMINNWAKKWETDKDDMATQISGLQEKQRQTEVDLAREQGKVIILQDTMKHDRETWRKDRAELLEKIDALEKRIAELEHEIQSKDELLDRKDNLIKQLVKERDDAIAALEALNNKHLATIIDLNELKEKLEDCKDNKEDKITELVQPKPIEEEKDSA